MNQRKEEHDQRTPATAAAKSNTGGTKEGGTPQLKTPTPPLFAKGAMKPSEARKVKEQSERVRKANEAFAASVSSKGKKTDDNKGSGEGNEKRQDL